MSVNGQVLTFARHRMGKKVGRGECWDLAEEALRSAGARTSRDLGPVHEDSDYVWGVEVPQGSIEPGDILQFRNHHIAIRIDTIKAGRSEWETKEENRPHHTAIVASVGENGAMYVYEQNVFQEKKVMKNLIYLRSSRTEVVSRGATVITQITVAGTVWCYRPQSKPVQ